MALSLNKPKLDNLASDIWKSAERLRRKFKTYEYQSVILPIIVIRRLECVFVSGVSQSGQFKAIAGKNIEKAIKYMKKLARAKTVLADAEDRQI